VNVRQSVRILVGLVISLWITSSFAAFVDDFNAPGLTLDTDARTGWAFFTGDGTATMTFAKGGEGYATMTVDGTTDRRGIWWALIKRDVSSGLKTDLLKRPGYAVRVEARVRLHTAPRRINLSLNTPRTTDFHKDLTEFDFDDMQWHTISFTDPDLKVTPGEPVYAQLAMMDWGLEKYAVDIDYFKVDVVNVKRAGPDLGVLVPYQPPVADPRSFRSSATVSQDVTIDLANPDINLNNWYVREGVSRKHMVTVNGTQYALFRFDLGAFKGKQIADSGLLEVTTQSVQRTSDEIKDFGQVRVVEILGGDPNWDQQTVTVDSFCKGEPITHVLNTQMIIDWPISEGDGVRTYLTISKPVLQRLVDGKTLGIAIKPLGSINAALYSMEEADGQHAAKLLFNVVEHKK
jgi:hypothetical protein